jgi:hypothetical protein
VVVVGRVPAVVQATVPSGDPKIFFLSGISIRTYLAVGGSHGDREVSRGGGRQKPALGALKKGMVLQIVQWSCTVIFVMLMVIMSTIDVRSSSSPGRLRTLWDTRLRG